MKNGKFFRDKSEVYSFLEQVSLHSDSFLNDEIIDKDEINPFIAFACEKLWVNNSSVNVFDVVGSAHLDYTGKTWENLIHNGRRMNHNISLLIENPEYYLEETKKDPTMYYIQVGDKIFIGNDGTYRTALAKLLFTKIKQTEIKGIDLVHYQIDYELKKAYEELLSSISKLPFQVRLLSKVNAREDGNGWMKEKISLKLQIINSRNQRELILSDARIIRDFISEIRSMGFFKRFIKSDFRDFIYSS